MARSSAATRGKGTAGDAGLLISVPEYSYTRLVRVLLISTYDLGRQPFGLASPAAWLRSAGFDVAAVDVSRTPLNDDDITAAGLIALYLPMHTATRLAQPLLDRIMRL